MNNANLKNSILYLLYYTATEENSDDSFIYQYLDKSEGIPIGKLFFWIKGLWQQDVGQFVEPAEDLYQKLMGVSPIDFGDDQTIGPFQNIEELKRFAYLLCQDLNLSMVKLISVDEFNQACCSFSKKSEILAHIDEVGDTLENLDVAKNQNFFSKVLSRN